MDALTDAGLTEADVAGHPRTGLFCASAGSAMLLHHNLAQMHAVKGERGNPLGVVSSIAGTLNFNLAAHFHVTGSVCGFVSACASSSHALGYACDEIRLGRMDRVIVVGAEEINADTLLPFMAMRALTPNDNPATASRPFDRLRDGFVGGGGAVVTILENAECALERGARIYGEVAGWGQAADGHSVAVSHPDGAGLKRAIKHALADAGASPGDVDAVNGHATSTPVGDRAEAIALHSVFHDADASPPVSSTKGLTGHPLSMSGVMEAGFCLLQISRGFMAGNANLQEPDEAGGRFNLPREATNLDIGLMLNNSSGFGGSNVCHLFRKWPG
jgi:3-oxoacyl-(acyl-carrier-protein) synthase